jgi:hypothetical protein
MSHDTALALIYGPVLGAWFFPLLLSTLNLFGASSRTSFQLACIVTVIAGVTFSGELLWQDRADNKRWNRAGLIDTLAKDIRDLLSQDAPDANNRDAEIDKILDERQILEEKIEFARVGGVPDSSSLKDNDLLIEFRYINGPDSFGKAVDGIVENIVNNRFPKKCAEYLTSMPGLSARSMSSHLGAASSPWRIPVLSARVSRASSRVPAAARKSFEASSWVSQRPHGRLLALDSLFHAAGWVG